MMKTSYEAEIKQLREQLALPAGQLDDAKGAVEHLDLQNHQLRRAMQKMMARLTKLLDEDQFSSIEEIARAGGVEPPAVAQPVADEREAK